MKSKRTMLWLTVPIWVGLSTTMTHAEDARGPSWRPAQGLPSSKNKETVQVRTLSSAGTRIELEYAMPTLQAEKCAPAESGPPTVPQQKNKGGTTGAKASRLRLGNAPLAGAPGKPVLPVVPCRIALPAGTTVDKVVVNGDRKLILPGEHVIEHGQMPVPLIPGARVESVAQDPAVYDVDDPYPNKLYEVIGVQKKRGVCILLVNLYPVIYKPKSKNISCFETLTLSVTTKFSPSKNVAGHSGKPNEIRYRRDSVRPAETEVDNPETLATYSDAQSGLPQFHALGPEPGAAPPPPQTLGVCDPSNSYQYVVVTSEDFINATNDVTINDLVAHRQALGLTATIVTIESVLTNYAGVDDAEKLRNFIIDAYNNWGTDYVLLGGDTNIIPMRKLWCDPFNGEFGNHDYIDHIPSDLYYQCLDGSYNSDGDNRWGEPTDGDGGGDVDLMAEVYIGRASAENAEEMANFVYKTLAYENEAAGADYLRRALMVGEGLGFGGPSEWANASMEEIRTGTNTHGYTTAGFESSPGFTAETLYDYPDYDYNHNNRYESWGSTPDGWPQSMIVNLINSNRYSVINHLGHANYNYVMRFYNDDADAMITNTSYFFAYSQGCIPGDFARDCMAEHLTTSTRHGAFAVVFNARYGWGAGYSTDGPSQRFDREFWDACFSEMILNIGAMNVDSHEDNLWGLTDYCIRWCYYESNLLGDPYTWIRGHSQKPLVVIESVEVDDSAGGNGNGWLNPGEEVALDVVLKNAGLDSVQGVSATLSVEDPYVTVIDDTAIFGDIASSGATHQVLGAYVIQVDSNCPTPYEVTLNLAITDSASNSWADSFTLTVYVAGRISGTVTLDAGSLEGATVAYNGPIAGSVQTKTDGTYTFDAIDGSYTLVASNADYLASEPLEITVPPDGKNVDFAFSNATISGTVTDAFTGDPVQDAVVEYTGLLSNSVVTAADGTYSIPRIYGREATLSLVAKMPGVYFDSARQEVTVPPDVGSVDFQLNAPDIDVNPNSFEYTLMLGQVATGTLTIANMRSRNLNWSVWNQTAPDESGVVRQFRPEQISGSWDAAFDGSVLWMTMRNTTLYKIDPLDGSCLGTLDVSSICSNVQNLAWDGTNMWISDSTQKKIMAVDLATLSVVKRFNTPNSIIPGGLTHGGGAVWMQNYPTTYKLDPETGVLLASFVKPAAITGWIYGITYYNGALWFPTYNGNNMVYKVNPKDGSLISSFHGPDRYVTGISTDEAGRLWLVSYYSNTVYLVDSGELPWLVEDAMSGTVPGTNSVDLTVAFDSTKVGIGRHEAIIHVKSDDPDEPDVTIPITLTVKTETPSLVCESTVVNEDAVGPSAGDGDGFAEPGETIEIDVVVRNWGAQTATGLSGVLSTTDSNVIITTGNAVFSDALSGQAVTNASPFVVEIAGDCPDRHRASFTLTMTDEQSNQWTMVFDQDVVCWCRLRGVVTDVADGDPIPGATVYVSGRGYYQTDSNGTYEVTGLGAGTYTVSAYKTSAGYVRETQTVTLPPDSQLDFQLGRPQISVSPTNISHVLLPGGRGGQTVVIANVGTRPLTWSACHRVPGFTFSDSDTEGGPEYSWIEIGSTGTKLDLRYGVVVVGPYNIGFNFPFYTNTVNKFWISVDGWLSLTESSASTSWQTGLPNPSAPANMVAPFWDSGLYVGPYDGGAVYYQKVDDETLVVEYKNMPKSRYYSRYVTFQAILKADGRIIYQYKDAEPDISRYCTVGVQDGTRGQGLQIACNSSYLKSHLAVELTPDVTWLSIGPVTGAGQPGDEMPLTVTFDASNLETGLYETVLVVKSDDADRPTIEIPVALTITNGEYRTITATPGPHGFISPSGDVLVEHGGSASFVIQAEPHASIADVDVNGLSIGPTNAYVFTDVTSNQAIHATFVLDQHKLVVTTPYGTAVPSGTNTYDYGTSTNCAIVNSPLEHGATQFVCIGWTGTGSVRGLGQTTNVNVTITTNSTLTWQWGTNYWLEATVTGNGGVTGGDHWYALGTSATITAVASVGYHFVGWAGDVPADNTNDNPVTLTMDRPQTVTANFAINTYEITASAGPNGRISPSGVVEVAHGDSASFLVGADGHHHIVSVDTSAGSVLGPCANNALCNTNVVWNNITTGGWIRASFAENLWMNGTPETWLAQYYPETNDYLIAAMSDTDNDGMAAWQEYTAGTDPTNAASVLAISDICISEGSEPVIQWYSVSNKFYTIRRTTNLLEGFAEVLKSNIPATPPVNAYTGTVSQVGICFYRIAVE